MRNDYKTRFKADSDRPKGKPRALRFPAEIEDIIENETEDWKAFVIEAVQQKVSSPIHSDEEGDRGIALEMFNRLRILLPNVAKQYPENGRLSLQARGLAIEMTCSDRPWFSVKGGSEFKLQMLNDDWLIEGDSAIAWGELKAAQDFCENMMHIWEQVMLSFEFADRIV